MLIQKNEISLPKKAPGEPPPLIRELETENDHFQSILKNSKKLFFNCLIFFDAITRKIN